MLQKTMTLFVVSDKKMEENDMALINGSEKYYKIKESAERIYEKRCAARSSSEREVYEKQGENLEDQLRAEYGFNDSEVNYIIDRFLR